MATHLRCSGPGCDDTCGNNKWAKIAAHEQGWFFERSGAVWCPEHLPDWVEPWRIEQRYEACLEYELEEDDE